MKQSGDNSVKDESAGLLVSGKPAFLAVGKLTRPHGVHGEILMQILTDFPDRIKPGSKVFTGEHKSPQVVKSIRSHSAGAIVGFEGYQDPESVGRLRNHFVFVSAQGLPDLPEGEYYHHQLIGLKVRTIQDRVLGELVEILQTGANDVLVVQTETGSEILIPYIDEIVQRTDLEKGELLIDPLPGLLPD